MKLSGKRLGELRAAVLDAITDEADLARLVRDGLDIRLEEVVKPGNLTDVVDQLLKFLETRGELARFIDVMAHERPHLAESLKAFRDLAAARPESLERPQTGGGDGNHASQDANEPLTPIHAPESWKTSFVIRGRRIGYASPDTTYEILEERLSQAETSILIGVYEFTSVPVKELVLSAVQRGVKVTLLLGSRFGPAPERPDFIDELAQKGVEVVEAPRGFHKTPFFIYHPKVLVIDRTWTLVQTGNLSPTSVPPDGERSGNRDTGIAIESPELADYFFGLLTHDKQLLLESRVATEGKTREKPDPRYTPYEPVRRFQALRMGGPPEPGRPTPPVGSVRPIRVLPVLAPDNYLENLTRLLSSARESIDVVEPYISSKGERTPNVRKVLDAFKDARARNPKLKVRVQLGTYTTRGQLEALQSDCNWLLPRVRILGTRSGLNVTNKLVIVDRRVVLVASVNWSEAGVSKNREVGLMIDSPEFAEYFGQIFDEDWKHGVSKFKAIEPEAE
jgi:phosphatidylserine/phosphatidylglycerophosphate/cardiolipin synthase-like enzyme